MKSARVGQVFIDLCGWDIGIVTELHDDHFVGHFSYADAKGAPHNYYYKHDMEDVINITGQMSRDDEVDRIMSVLKETFTDDRYTELIAAVKKERNEAKDL